MKGLYSNSRFFCLLVCCCFCISSFKFTTSNRPNRLYTLTGYAQGTSYSIQYLSDSSRIVKNEIDSIFKVLDYNFSLYSNSSLIKDFNQAARGVSITPHLSHVITYAKDIHAISHGSFDIAILNLLSLWGKGKKQDFTPPSPDEINKTLLSSGSHWIMILNDSLVKLNPNVQIDCDGIAQGYSVDVLASYLDAKHISSYLVEIGGEVKSKGKNAQGADWRIGFTTASLQNNVLINQQVLGLSGWACTTSGRLSKFTGTATQKISHIINPTSGYPVNNGIVSVTVIAKDAITADAYDNAFMVLGVEKSFALLKDSKNLGVHFVYESTPGQFKDTANAFFKSFINQ
jgi:thiamine biosynthesis lipoprotein